MGAVVAERWKTLLHGMAGRSDEGERLGTKGEERLMLETNLKRQEEEVGGSTPPAVVVEGHNFSVAIDTSRSSLLDSLNSDETFAPGHWIGQLGKLSRGEGTMGL